MKFQETDGDSFEEMRSINQALSFDALKQEFKTRKIPFAEAQMQTLHMQSTDRLYTEGNHQKRIARTLGSQPVYCGPHSKNHGGPGADHKTGGVALPHVTEQCCNVLLSLFVLPPKLILSIASTKGGTHFFYKPAGQS